MGRHEDRDPAVIEASDSNPPEPARMNAFVRFRIRRVDDIAGIDHQSAHATELRVLAARMFRPSSGSESVVVAVRDAISRATRIESLARRRAELARAACRLLPIRPAGTSRSCRTPRCGLPDAFAHVGVTLRDVHVAVAPDRSGPRSGSVSASGRIPLHAGRANRHEHLPIGAELDHALPLCLLSGKLPEVVRTRRARIGHPDVSVAST